MRRLTAVRRPAGRAPRDPYGIAPSGALVAPLLSFVGLGILGLLTLALFTGQVPFGGASGGGDGGNGPGSAGGDGSPRTPAPTDVVNVDPRADVPGSIVYVKQGSIWIQSGTSARRLTRTGRDTMPSWSPDGDWIYFIRTVSERGLFPAQGDPSFYTLTYPLLMRIRPDGSAEPEQLATGKYKTGRYTWFYWMRQPVVSPNGRTVALVSDAPDPTRTDLVVQFLDLETGKLSRPALPESPPLGHQDPAWRSDGKLLLYVKNGRDGSRGAPAIARYDTKSKKFAVITGPGYTSPAWSPDGRYIAATKTDAFGTDIVILDAKGSELLRVTNDDSSWAPVWSPRGDAIAYLHIEGRIVDLVMVTLEGSGPDWSPGETIALTNASDLDPSSRPGWFIPAEQLPPSPAPSTSPSPSAP